MKTIQQKLMIVFSILMLVLTGTGFVTTLFVPRSMRKEQRRIEEMIRQKQEEAAKAREEAKAKAAGNKPLTLAEMQDLYDDASEMNIIMVGDSVMLAAYDALQAQFPNAYIDAVFGRAIGESTQALQDLADKNQLSTVVVLSVGTNSTITDDQVEKLIDICGERPVFFITTYGVTNDSNKKQAEVAAKHDNAYIIDWESLAMEHMNEYILADHLHPNEEGSKAYAKLIDDEITKDLDLKGHNDEADKDKTKE